MRAAPIVAKIAHGRMESALTTFLGFLFVLWCAAGLVLAGAFVARGADVALGEPTTLTSGARLLLLPGAFLLWPLVLYRWLRAGNAA